MNTIEMIYVGNMVEILECEQCIEIVGKKVVVNQILENDKFVLCFGRGRPQRNRPHTFLRNQLRLLDS